MKVLALLASSIVLSACGGSGDSQPVTSAASGASTTTAVINPPVPTMQHIISYGQSISLGEEATNNWPTDTSLPPQPVNVGWMFTGGTRPEDLSSLVPFQEAFEQCDLAIWNCDVAGETPLYGAMAALQWTGARLLGSAAGRGGTAIVGLMKGTDPYQRVIDQVEAGKSLAEGPYSVLGIIWIQGSSDAGNTAYTSEFEQLVMDLDSDIRNITGQPDPIQFYVCLSTADDIDIATQAVAATMPQVHIVCDTRLLQHNTVGAHLTAAAEIQAGQMLGGAMGQVYTAQHP